MKKAEKKLSNMWPCVLKLWMSFDPSFYVTYFSIFSFISMHCSIIKFSENCEGC